MSIQGCSVSSAQPQVQIQQTQQSRCAPPAQQAPYCAKDSFAAGIEKAGALLARPRVTLNLADRFTSARLPNALSSPGNRFALAFGRKSETITSDGRGNYRGPDGQPLARVRLRDGNTAYVDPNTNKYYLTNQGPDCFGRVKTLPARDLPKGARFTNEYFTDADVKTVQQIARNGMPLLRGIGAAQVNAAKIGG